MFVIQKKRTGGDSNPTHIFAVHTTSPEACPYLREGESNFNRTNDPMALHRLSYSVRILLLLSLEKSYIGIYTSKACRGDRVQLFPRL